MITLDDWLTSSGKYPERKLSPELNQSIKDAANMLLNKINALMADLGVLNVSISSGYRPSSVNNKIPNAAKKSAHMSGLAIDIIDVDGSLKLKVKARPDLLRKHGLFMEHPDYTKTWLHLDCVNRADRPTRLFIPK